MKTITVTKKELGDSKRFVEQIENAFSTSTPPIVLRINDSNDTFDLACLFTAKHSNSAKRFFCKCTNPVVSSNYSAADISAFPKSRYPIELYVESIQDLEDFADGYISSLPNSSTPVIEQPHRKSVPQKTYEVNPFAELFLDKVNKISLILGWVLTGIVFIIGIVAAFSGGGLYNFFLGLIAAACVLFVTYAVWAVNKVVINISNNLFNINEQLKNK